MRLNSAFVFAATCLLSATLHAADLNTIYHMAQAQDPVIHSAYHERQAIRENIPQSRAALLPALSFSADTASADTSNNVDSFNTHHVTLSLSQAVYHYDAWRRFFQAKKLDKSARAAYAAAEQMLIFRVATQYFATLSANDVLHFALSQRKAFSRQLEQIRERYRVGLAAMTEVHEAQARFDNAVAAVLAAKNELRDAYELLEEMTGQPIKSVATLGQIKLLPPQPNKMENWVAQATSQNFELKSAMYQLKAAKDEISIARAGHWPTLDLTGNISRVKAARPISQDATAKDVRLTLTVPLFASGATWAKTTQAQYNFKKSHDDFDQMYRNVISQCRQAFRGVMTQISQVKALEQALISSRSALKATRASYDVGTRTIVNVLDAQSDVFKAEKNLSQARYQYLLEGLHLKLMAGILSPADLNAINQHLRL